MVSKPITAINNNNNNNNNNKLSFYQMSVLVCRSLARSRSHHITSLIFDTMCFVSSCQGQIGGLGRYPLSSMCAIVSI